jgi:hypothetical protein
MNSVFLLLWTFTLGSVERALWIGWMTYIILPLWADRLDAVQPAI